MPLNKAVVQIPLTGGVDRKTDSHQLQSGQMYTADNVVYVSEKQIKKRNGYASINPPGGLQGAPFTALGNRDNVEPVILGQNTLNRYNTQTGLSTFIPALTQGRINTKQVASTSGGANSSVPSNLQAVSDGTSYVFLVYTESGLNWWGVQDLATGNWIISPRQFTSPVSTYNGYKVTSLINFKVLYYNGYFYLGYQAGGFDNSAPANPFAFFGFYAVSLLNLAYSFADTGLRIAGTLTGNPNPYSGAFDYSAAIDSSGTLNFLTADPAAKTPGQITYYTVNGATFTALPKTTTLPLPAGTQLPSQIVEFDIGVNGPTAAPITANASGIIYGVTSAGTTTSGKTTSQPLFETPRGIYYNGLWVYALQYGGQTPNFASQFLVAQFNPVTNTALPAIALVPPVRTEFSRSYSCLFPGKNPGFLYMWVVATSTAGTSDYLSAFLYEINLTTQTSAIIGRCFYLSCAKVTSQCQVIKVGNNQWATYMPTSTDALGMFGVVNRVVFDFTPFRQNALLQLPTGGLIGAGALPYQYDGQRILEQGFSIPPNVDDQFVQTTVQSPAIGNGGLTSSFTYSWQFVFVKRDAYGNEIRSAPGAAYMLPISKTFQNTTMFVKFQFAFQYNNDAYVTVEAYRNTVANPAEFYLVTTFSNGATWTDDYADANIVTHRNLYTYSGELPNDPCPPVHCMAISESRAYVIPSDARNTVWASKQFAPGRSVEFNASLVLSEGRNSGLFTAIGVLDSNIIVFKEDAVLYFYGSGPDNTGANGSFSAFTKLSSDVGCVDPNSLAVIPAGLLFRSRRGIELLTRGLQVQYVGFPVEPYVQAITTINASVVLPQYNQVRFMSPVASDPTLVYDYAFNRWSTFSNTSVTASNTISGRYWNISPDGSTVLMETPGIFSDNGSNIIMTLETPEVDLAGMQGWGRAYRMAVLGDFKSSHQMNVSFAYDHSPAYQDQVGFSMAIQADIDFVLQNLSFQFTDVGWDLENPKSGQNSYLPYVTPTSLGRAPTVAVPPCAEQFRLSRMPRQRMQSCRIMMQDTPVLVSYSNDGTYQTTPLAFGESCAISGITMEYGQKAGVAKLGPQRTV